METYTLTLVIKSSTAQQILIQDQMPSQVGFVHFAPGSFTNGQISNSNIEWNLGSVPPGTYTLTFSVQTNTGLPNGSILINNASVMYLGNNTGISANAITVISNQLTPTPTATASFSGIVSPPYPNPAGPGQSTHIQVHVNQPSQVQLQVFTIAYRLIYETSEFLNSNGVLRWNLRDESGQWVANGVYDVRIIVQNPSGTFEKIDKVIVLR